MTHEVTSRSSRFYQPPSRRTATSCTVERETKVLASLNHPNIAQIHCIEKRPLVMELVPRDAEGSLGAGPPH